MEAVKSEVGYGTATVRPQPEEPTVSGSLANANDRLSDLNGVVNAICERLNVSLPTAPGDGKVPIGIPGQIQSIHGWLDEIGPKLRAVANIL